MDTIKVIKEIQNDIRNLKLKAFQPNKVHAEIFKDYFSWEDDNPKKNFEILYAKEIGLLNEWFKVYCKESSCSKEDALERIIEG